MPAAIPGSSFSTAMVVARGDCAGPCVGSRDDRPEPMTRAGRTRMDAIAPVAGFVDAALAKLGVDPKWRAIAEWPQICGPTIAARTIPERIVGRTLVVRVSS